MTKYIMILVGVSLIASIMMDARVGNEQKSGLLDSPYPPSLKRTIGFS